jgi:hypothetical protein
MFRQKSTPVTRPTDRAGDAEGHAGHEEDAQDRGLAGPHGAQDADVAALVLHQHDDARDDVQAAMATTNIRMMPHRMARSTCRASKKLWFLSVQSLTLPPGTGRGRQQRLDQSRRIRVVDHDLDASTRLSASEEQLGLFRAACR